MSQLKKYKEYHHSDKEFDDLNKVIGKHEKEINRLKVRCSKQECWMNAHKRRQP